MITLDYIGQELIWKLRGVHPYEKNFSSYAVNIKCHTHEQNEIAKTFFLSHLQPELLKDVTIVLMEWETGIRSTVTEITINNVFGKESHVYFINDAKTIYYEEEENENSGLRQTDE